MRIRGRFWCAGLLVAMLVLPTSLVVQGDPEPVLSEVDVFFAPAGVQVVGGPTIHIGSVTRLSAQLEASGQQVWTKAGVVVDRGGAGEPDSVSVNTPSVMYENGEYRMWYAGTDAPWPKCWILHANSSDGLTWTKYGVVHSFGAPGEDLGIITPNVIKDGGIYKMWYAGWDGSKYRIFHATSIDGLVWTRQGLAVDIGPAGSLDSNYAYSPYVMIDGMYRMWYAGYDGTTTRILHANSTDGVNWTKQGISIDVGPPGSLDSGYINSFSVLKEGGGYHAWYTGNDGSTARTFYATSDNGTIWNKKGMVVDVGPGSSESIWIFAMNVMHRAGKPYEMWYTGRGPGPVDRIHYANLTHYPRDVEVGFYLNNISPGSEIGTNVTQVGALYTAATEFDWTPLALGHHYIWAVIDPSNNIAETNEDNNTAFVQVDVTNNAPVADAGPDQSVTRYRQAFLNGTACFDPDGDPLSFIWVQIGGLPLVLLNPDTATPEVLPVYSGTATFRLTVHDDWGGFSTDTTNLTVTNSPPVPNAGPDMTVSKNTVVQLDGTGTSDPESDTLIYYWEQTGGPPVTLYNFLRSTSTFIPTIVGYYIFRLTVSDGEYVLADTVNVTVTNTGPVADAGPDMNPWKRTLVMLNGSGSFDGDGDALSFTWTQLVGPSVQLTGGDTATPVFMPVVAGLYTFSMTVDDGDGGTDSDVVNVTVTNRVPIADAGLNESVSKKTTVLLDGRGSSDEDGDPLSYSWTQTEGPAVVLNSADTATPSFRPPLSGTYSFRLTVDDGDGGTDSDVVTITATNGDPTADAGPDITAQKRTMVTLDASGSSDPDGDALQLTWTQTGGPSVTINDPNGITATFVATAAGTYTFVLTVDDGDGGNDTDTVQVTVWGLAPLAFIKTNFTNAIVDDVFYFDGAMSSDPDGSIVDYKFDFGDGTVAVNGTAAARSHAFTQVGTYIVRLTVTDNDGNTTSTTVSVRIDAPPEPPQDLFVWLLLLLILLIVLIVVVIVLANERRKWKRKALEAEAGKPQETEEVVEEQGDTGGS